MRHAPFQKYMLLFLMLVAAAAPAHGLDVVWKGLNLNFNDSVNWASNVPTATDDAVFSAPGSFKLSIATQTAVTQFFYANTAGAYTNTLVAPATLTNYAVTVGTGGIVNQSANLQRFQTSAGVNLLVNGPVSGNVQIANTGGNSQVLLTSNALIGNVNIVNQSTGDISLQAIGAGTISAGKALLENNGGGTFHLDKGFRGDQATILNTSGDLLVGSDADLKSATIVNASRLSIANIAGSTVAVGSLSGAGSVFLANKQLAVGANGDNSEISGVISGVGGSFVKVGTGTVVLSGANTYTAGTVISAGILKANTTSLQGNVTDNAILTFDQLQSGVFSGSLSGTGIVTKTGPGILGVTGISSFSGTFGVDGPIEVTGTIPANLTLGRNGLLFGNGTIGAVTNGGTVRPGENGAGALTVGNYTMQGGTLEIPFDGATHPMLRVAGTATLTGGRLLLSGTKFDTGTYAILATTSPNKVSGIFDTVAAPPFLRYNVQLLNATTVQVALQSYNLWNAASAATSNQQSVAKALDNVLSGAATAAAGGSAPTAIAGQKLFLLNSDAVVHQAFEQLSGDSLTSFYDVGLRQGRLFTEGVTERAVPMDSAATVRAAGPAAPIQLAMNGSAAGLGAGAKHARKARGLWGRILGAFADTDSDSSTGSPESTANTGGFQAGYDVALGDDLTVGGFLGYTRTGVTVDDRDSSGTTNSIGLGAYSRFSPGKWFFDGSLAYVHNSNTMDRPITFVHQTAHSDFSSPLITLYGDAGYAFAPAHDTALEPFVGMRISHLSQSGFTESGASGEDLIVDQQSVNSVTPITAVRMTHLFSAESRHPFLLGATLGLEYELGTTDRAITARFADGSSPEFTVQGTPQKRTALDVGVGGRLAISERWQAYATYGLTAASEHFAQAIMGGARLKW